MRAHAGRLAIQESRHVIRQALADELPVCRRPSRRSTLAAGQQRLFLHDGSGDDRAPHPIPILDVDRARRADLRVQAPQPMHSSAGRVKSK